MKKIAVLGSTGSIGTQTLEIVRANGDIRVESVAAGSNIDLLEKQIREFRPRIAAVWNEEKAKELSVRVADTRTRVLSGKEGIIAAATVEKADTVVTGIVGMIGIEPTIAAIRCGKDIALANKETLVCAGHIIMPLAKERGVRILPVDSEHSAIFQSLRGNKKNRIAKILLTASGGPFRNYTAAKLKKVTLEDALKHPNWSMGKKVTIDSSTMVNKGLEVMEAHWLFNVDYKDIQVVIQPQSIIHSMVEYEDGAVIAQLGVPDMKLPIQYALYYPKRRFLGGGRLDFAAMKSIEIAAPDMKKFPGLKLAYEAGKTGGSMPTVFNAANEAAVRAFLEKKIGWGDIAKMIASSMEQHEKVGILSDPQVEDILAIRKNTETWLAERFKI
jgi:1-deoxy-D-xylulose-5-phosphate reductoisomerase